MNVSDCVATATGHILNSSNSVLIPRGMFKYLPNIFIGHTVELREKFRWYGTGTDLAVQIKPVSQQNPTANIS